MALRIDGGIGWSISSDGATDPFIDNVKMRMLMTTATDEEGATVTPTGTPTFGDGSVNGAGDAGSVLTLSGDDVVTVANTNVTTMGASDWTIEFWYNTPAFTASEATIGSYTNPPLYWAFHRVNNEMLFAADQGVGTTWDIVPTTTVMTIPAIDTWYHIAATWDGTTYRGFRDGVQQWTVVSSVEIGTLTTPIQIGANPSNTAQDRMTGSLDDLRITVGTARYTSNFTKPTAEFPLS